MSQNAQEENRTESTSERQALPSDPIGCYLPLLGFMLAMSMMVYFYVVISLPTYRIFMRDSGGASVIGLLEKLLISLHVPLGILFSWMMAGIFICLLLYIWFKLQFAYTRAVFAAVAGIAVLWWIAGLIGQLKGAQPSPIFERLVEVFIGPFFVLVGASTDKVMGLLSPALVVVLSLGVLALPAIWYWRSTMWSTAVVFWFMLWLALLFGVGEYRVGVALLTSLVIGSAIFMFGLRSTSGFLLPLPGREHRDKALGFLRDWAQRYNYPGYVVVDELYEEDKIEMRVPGSRFREPGFGAGPGFIISDCNYAVAVSSSTKFKGVKGPGVIFTGYADQVMQTVDLRPQLRGFPMEAVTRDGIRIKTAIFASCKIDSRGRLPRLGESLPYSPAAGFKAIRSQEMRHERQGQTQDRMKGFKWEELPGLIATRILQDIISRYDFDDLYGPYQPGGEPRRKVVADELMAQLRDELKTMGIELVGGGISDLQPTDPDVYVKRAQNWKEGWEYKIALQKSESQTAWLKMVERARMEAQADLILAIGRRLESSMTRAEVRPHAALTQFVKLLDELMKQHPSLEGVVPEKTVETLMELRNIVE
jgi:hypothetical protein